MKEGFDIYIYLKNPGLLPVPIRVRLDQNPVQKKYLLTFDDICKVALTRKYVLILKKKFFTRKMWTGMDIFIISFLQLHSLESKTLGKVYLANKPLRYYRQGGERGSALAL